MGILDRFKKKEEVAGMGTAIVAKPVYDNATIAVAQEADNGQLPIVEEPTAFMEQHIDMTNLTLDELLEKATNEPPYRAEFYRRLLTDELVVIMQKEMPASGQPAGEDDEADVQIASFPDGVIPVFTSVDRMYDKGVNKEQLLNMQMTGDKLLVLLKGRTLVVNPYSDFGKQLLPEEVEKMLDGTIFQPGNIDMEVKQPQQVRLGIPNVYPTEVMEALTKMYAGRAEVTRAYVAFIQFEGVQEQPHYIYAIEENSGGQQIGQDTGALIQQMRPGEIFDLVRLPGNTFDEFFYEHHQPFYTK